MLAIRNLRKTYQNGIRALDGLALDVPPGMFGLLGPNGAGKSSLMRTLATLQEADSGSVSLDGRDGKAIDVLREKDAVRRELGYLPQDFGLYPGTSALVLLDHMAVLKGLTDRRQRREIVEDLLHRMNLWNVRKQHLTGFSGGMRQRFGIAQALLGNPGLVIVDEPTAGLDPEERNRILNLLADIGDKVTVILSTHIVEDVADLCPNMAIMGNGKSLYAGRPGDAIASLEGRIWRKKVTKGTLDDCKRRFNVLSTRMMAGNPVIHVLSDDCPDTGFDRISPSLEDAYFHRLGLRAATT